MISHTLSFVTPDNIDVCREAAEAGDGYARQVLAALYMWADDIARRKYLCINPKCLHRGRPFNAEFEPMVVVIGVPEQSEEGFVGGICEDCAKHPDIPGMALRALAKTLNVETVEVSHGHTVH